MRMKRISPISWLDSPKVLNQEDFEKLTIENKLNDIIATINEMNTLHKTPASKEPEVKFCDDCKHYRYLYGCKPENQCLKYMAKSATCNAYYGIKCARDEREHNTAECKPKGLNWEPK